MRIKVGLKIGDSGRKCYFSIIAERAQKPATAVVLTDIGNSGIYE
jgi:hypothetical protein